MLLEHILDCVNDIYEDVMEGTSPELMNVLKQLEEEAHDSSVDLTKKAIMLSMTLCMSQLEFDDDLFEGLLLENLDHFVKHIPDMKKTMSLRIELRGLEKNVNRVIKVPYGMVLADLAYLILASMNAEGEHLFTFISDEGKYGCDQCDGEMIDGYAADMTIADLSLHEGSHLVLWYDFGDDYFFDIHVMDVDEHNDIQSLDDLKVLAGEGYGIWEDEHQLLELYYENQEEFLRVVSEMGLNEDDFILEDFDVDDANEFLLDNYEFLKTSYEVYDEDVY